MARVSDDRCPGGCDYCTSSCEYYNDPIEYYVCDGCGESEVTLYIDGKKHYCASCLANAHREDFINALWDEILEEFADEYAEGYDVVDQEE